jgi:threonine/homoserine/homoserine lactone efflux protein
MLGQIAVIVSVTFLAMVTPGPDMVLVLRNTFVSGRRAGLHTSVGVLTGNLVHVSYGVLGIGWLISQSILAFEVLRYAAAAYLIYLGVSSFRSGQTTLKTADRVDWQSERHWFLQGFINNVLNPKGALFYVGVFTMVIVPGTSASARLVLIASMLLVSTSFWLVFIWTLDRPSVRGLIERSRVKVNRVLGGLLILLGVRVALVDR